MLMDKCSQIRGILWQNARITVAGQICESRDGHEKFTALIITPKWLPQNCSRLTSLHNKFQYQVCCWSVLWQI